MIIDQHRAHVRILFEQYLNQIQQRKGLSQRVLFPEIIELNPAEAAALESIIEDIEAVGFELTSLGNNSFVCASYTFRTAKTRIQSKLLRSMIEAVSIQDWT